MVETNINAYREELVIAESELSRAQGRYDELKAHVDAHDKAEAKETKEDVESEAEQPKLETHNDSSSEKSLNKQNREELNATAKVEGLQDPDQYETKSDLIVAIEANREDVESDQESEN